MSFQTLNLDARLLRAIEASGFTQPTDIQRQAIPVVLEGRDLMASAQTGTGKTAAFVLPALQRLLTPRKQPGHGPRVLVLSPTRELAMQINEAIQQFGRQTRHRTGVVVGGVPYPAQVKMLRGPLDFLVATPGRLLDHMERGRIDFSSVELFILDEADRMLDMGFIEDVENIAAEIPGHRQTLLFSATLEGQVLRIARKLMNDPAQIQLAAVKEKHASIEQRIHQADNLKHKNALLAHLLNDQALTQAVVFTATKRGADELAEELIDQGHACAALHGDMKQGARKRTIERMRLGKFRILVATDVAARGLDIRGISHVINYDLPMVAEDYVHRIGRTGRGGASGIAVSLVERQDWPKLASIERFTGQRLERQVIPGLEPTRQEPAKPSHGKRPPSGGRPGNRSSRPYAKQGAPRDRDRKPHSEGRFAKDRGNSSNKGTLRVRPAARQSRSAA